MRSLVPWFAVGLLVQALIAGGLFLWARWVGRRLGTAGWRRAAWLPAVALVVNLGGLGAAAWLAGRAPASPGPVGPEARRAYYRQWTAPAAAGLGSAALAALLYAGSTLISLAGTTRVSGPRPPREIAP